MEDYLVETGAYVSERTLRVVKQSDIYCTLSNVFYVSVPN